MRWPSAGAIATAKTIRYGLSGHGVTAIPTTISAPYDRQARALQIDDLIGVLARGYLAKRLGNKQVVRSLKQRQPGVLAEFETIIQTVSLEQCRFAAQAGHGLSGLRQLGTCPQAMVFRQV